MYTTELYPLDHTCALFYLVIGYTVEVEPLIMSEYDDSESDSDWKENSQPGNVFSSKKKKVLIFSI